MSKMIPLRLGNGKLVGRIEGGVAIIPATPRHYFAILHGVSVDNAVLNQILRHRVKTIEIQYTSKKKTDRLRIGVVDFMSLKQQTPNFGYGAKWVVDEKHYKKVEKVA